MKHNSEFKLIGYPQHKQKEFFLAKTKYIAYGGARGGGKSWGLRRKIVLLALNYAGISILLIRRTLPELRDNHIRPLLSELSAFCNYSEVRKTFEFPNGSRIRLGYLDGDGDLYSIRDRSMTLSPLMRQHSLQSTSFRRLKHV